MKNKTLIVGPKPPPIGGIASIVSLLMKEFENYQHVNFINSSKKQTTKCLTILLPFSLLYKICVYCVLNHGSNILIFSSAFRSFWEKLIWILISSLSDTQIYIVMVDGNFPVFFSKLPSGKKMLSRFIMKRAVVVGQSASWSQYYKSIFPDSKIGQITGGVDTSFFKPAEVNMKKKSVVTILYVGWIIKEKGIFDLLSAINELNNKGLDFNLNLVGPIYVDLDSLIALVKKYNLTEKVSLCGPIYSRESLRDIYQASDIFVFPSHFEGFPVALLEALSSGLPCIGTNIGGVPDILDYGKCGKLVEKESPSELANALSTYINDTELRAHLSNKSRKRALAKFSLSQSIMSYKELLSINE